MRKLLVLAICFILQISYTMQKISDINIHQNNFEQLSNSNILPDIQMKPNDIILDCSSITSNENNKEKEIQKTKKYRKYTCPKCDKSYTKKSLVCKHINDSHGEEKRAIYEKNLEYNTVFKVRLKKTALGQQLKKLFFTCFFHGCDACDTYFKLMKHMKIHITDEMPYRCLTGGCEERDHNKQHLIDKHSNLLFYCAHCVDNNENYSIFTNLYTAVNHYRKKHLISYISCPLGCKKPFLLESLKKHVDRVHKSLNPKEAGTIILKFRSSIRSKINAKSIPADAFIVLQNNNRNPS